MPISKDTLIKRLHQKYNDALLKYQATPNPYLCELMLKAKKKLNQHLKTELQNLKNQNLKNVNSSTTTHP